MLFDIGVVDHPEPFKKLVHQGMILGSDGEKMSKSRGNVINPDDVVREHGADALRLYEMFMGPLEATKPWQTNQLMGVVRFRDRVYSLLKNPLVDAEPTGDLLSDMHRTIKKVTEDIDRLSFNTAISTLMIFSNKLSAVDGAISKKAVETLVILLSPFAPHVAEECWSLMGHSKSLAHHPWPTYDEKLCEVLVATIAVQVNGKVRATMDIDKSCSQEDVLAMALEQATIAKWTQDKAIKKTVYIPGRILNILV